VAKSRKGDRASGGVHDKAGCPWDGLGYNARRWYRSFVEDFAELTSIGEPFCWACGRRQCDRPLWWYGPWLIERAHIVNKPRREDRRAVILLCSLCHKQQHGERFAQDESAKLTVANMVWLKQKADAAWFDMAFLSRCSVRIVPDGVEPMEHRKEFIRRWKAWW
jgi:hypothetical protein